MDGASRAEPTLKAYPQIRQILAPVFAGLDLTTLRDLNEKAAVEGEDAVASSHDNIWPREACCETAPSTKDLMIASY